MAFCLGFVDRGAYAYLRSITCTRGRCVKPTEWYFPKLRTVRTRPIPMVGCITLYRIDLCQEKIVLPRGASDLIYPGPAFPDPPQPGTKERLIRSNESLHEHFIPALLYGSLCPSIARVGFVFALPTISMRMGPVSGKQAPGNALMYDLDKRTMRILCLAANGGAASRAKVTGLASTFRSDVILYHSDQPGGTFHKSIQFLTVLAGDKVMTNRVGRNGTVYSISRLHS